MVVLVPKKGEIIVNTGNMWKAIGLSEPLPSPHLDEVNQCKESRADRTTEWHCGPLKFRADFDSSNLADAIPCGAKGEYDLWIRHDCGGQPCETKHRTWFYFAVSGHAEGQALTFNVVNMNKQSKLFSFDMRPTHFTPGVSEKWELVSESVKYQSLTSGSKITFSHKFTSEKETFFAFCVPFSCTDNERLMTEVERHAKTRNDIYFCREVLGYSKGGRKIDLLTISSNSGMLGTRESPTTYPAIDSGERAHMFDSTKKVFVVSSRVHPGETPATHVFNGFLAFLLQKDDERAIALRERYVFKLIPIINPDGVSLGHYRCDSHGQNLNRFYEDPQPDLQPEVLAVKSLILYYFEKGSAEVCIDLHAHANRMGSFAYGNHLDYQQQIETVMYTKLVSMNCPYFDFRSCSFSEKNMSSKDKNGESKEGSNRVALYRATNLVHIYTIETNYSCASLTNCVTEATNGSRTISPRNKVQSRSKFCIDSFGQIGKALLVGMLDVKDLNPYSRLKSSEFKNMQILRNWVTSHVNATLSKKFKGYPNAHSRAESVRVAVEVKERITRNSASTQENSKNTSMQRQDRKNSIILQNKEKIRTRSLLNRERRRSVSLQNRISEKESHPTNDPNLGKVRLQLLTQKLNVDSKETNENCKAIKVFQ